jgi:PTS system galactitol-specific IIA component
LEILNLIKKELVFPKLEVKNKNELFKVLYEELNKNGFVKESFLDGVLEREKKYPTGLQLKSFGCALPHTDHEHVIKPAISVAVLKNPVVFRSMENPQNEVSVNMVFMLALNKSEYQIEALKQLAMMIQNDSFFGKISKENKAEDILDIIKSFEVVGI